MRLRHYRYKVVDGQVSNVPLHDAASDGADAFRYLGISLGTGGPGRRIEALDPDISTRIREPFSDHGYSQLGWLGQ